MIDTSATSTKLEKEALLINIPNSPNSKQEGTFFMFFFP
jgi:hypothetical protein